MQRLDRQRVGTLRYSGPPRPVPLPERPPEGKLRTDSTYDWREIGEQVTLRPENARYSKTPRPEWQIWVIRRHAAALRRCPLYPLKRLPVPPRSADWRGGRILPSLRPRTSAEGHLRPSRWATRHAVTRRINRLSPGRGLPTRCVCKTKYVADCKTVRISN